MILILKCFNFINNKVMKKFLSICIVTLMSLMMSVSFSSCSSATPDAGQEGVFIKKPIFSRDGGVDMTPAKTGLEYCAWTTDVVYVTMTPVAYNETIDDALSSNNSPLDFSPVIYLQVQEGKSPVLIQNYGEHWYENNLKRVIIDKLVAEIGDFTSSELLSNQLAIDSINRTTKMYVEKYITKLSSKKEMPVNVIGISVGKAKANNEQLAEMNKTAQMIQMKESQTRREEAETARERAERQRAIADKAYMQAMNLSPEQYIQLKYIEMIADKKGANIDVMIGPATSMWNVRR